MHYFGFSAAGLRFTICLLLEDSSSGNLGVRTEPRGYVSADCGGGRGGVTWRQVLAAAAGVHQDVGVEGGIETFISTLSKKRRVNSQER